MMPPEIGTSERRRNHGLTFDLTQAARTRHLPPVTATSCGAQCGATGHDTMVRHDRCDEFATVRVSLPHPGAPCVTVVRRCVIAGTRPGRQGHVTVTTDCVSER